MYLIAGMAICKWYSLERGTESAPEQGLKGRVFKISGGSGSGFEKKKWVAGGLESGRSVEILDWVLLDTFFTLKYFRVSWVFLGI